MTAEIISVGTELLLGDILNTNARFLSRELAALGVSIYRQTTVGDNFERLVQAYGEAFSRADTVITSGGLGPTNDDLTKEAAAAYFGKKLVMNGEILLSIEKRFSGQSQKMPESNKKQAEVPEGAVVLENHNGTAPGLIITGDGKTAILLPGPPSEMEPMFTGQVAPYLQKRQGGALVSRTLKMCGIGESAMAEKVMDLTDGMANPTVAPYAGNFEARLRITAKAAGEEEAAGLITPVADEIYARLSEYIYGEGETELEEAVVGLLKQKRLTVAAAESCTGGMFTARLVNVPGASEVFKESFITYTNASKTARLGVKPETIGKYGAVSEETAAEMAKGAALAAGADVGVSITGIAGPSGGTDEKPAGLVYLGLYINGKTVCRETRTSGGRQRIRARAASQALEFLWRELKRM